MWDTSRVTDMSSMFSYATTFNQPLGHWNVTAVKDMSYMFKMAKSFQRPIGTWNTAAVEDMHGMFQYAAAFNQPVSAWNTAAVRDMINMFYKAKSFNQDVAAWNVSSVLKLNGIFHGATSFDQSLSTWQLTSFEEKHLTSIDGWYFKYLRRCMGIKASYYSHIPNKTVWIKAGRPTLPSQLLITQQLDKLVDSIQKPSTDPLHHVIFSPGYKDRIRHSKSAHRGHPRPYWFDIVSKQSVKLLQSFPDQSAIHRRDFLGVKHLISRSPAFRLHLHTAPTREAGSFKVYRKTLASAWRT